VIGLRTPVPRRATPSEPPSVRNVRMVQMSRLLCRRRRFGSRGDTQTHVVARLCNEYIQFVILSISPADDRQLFARRLESASPVAVCTLPRPSHTSTSPLQSPFHSLLGAAWSLSWQQNRLPKAPHARSSLRCKSTAPTGPSHVSAPYTVTACVRCPFSRSLRPLLQGS
jgi:hypothetical protein